jgi:hypothetical protein
MRPRLHFSALIAMFLIGATASAFAQGAGTSPGTGTVPPQNIGSAGITSAPGGSSTTSTGMGTGAGSRTNLTTGTNGSGSPNASAHGTEGIGTLPSGLPDNDPAHPGFPGIVGH